MALIKNVERTLTINASYGLSDLLTYMGSGATASTTEITVITQGKGTPDPTYLWKPGASSGGTFYTGRTTALMNNINATDLTLQAAPGTLAEWPNSGYIYFTSPAEGIYYSNIINYQASVSGNDEIVVASVSDRGWSGSATSHSIADVINEITVWYVQSINYDTVSGIFNFSYFAREAYRVNYLAPDIGGKVYSQDRSFSGSLFNAYELVEESAT